MKLITSENSSPKEGRGYSRPVPKKVIDSLRACVAADGSVVEKMLRKSQADAAIMGPMPVGGEDDYIASQR